MFNEAEYKLAEKGEIVSTKSPLAFDEEILCKQCGHIFTLVEGNWVGEHPRFKAIEMNGIKCPNCERVNVTYVKTPKLKALEKTLHDAPMNRRPAIRAKYQRLFKSVQKEYGVIK